jgi:hypothetical protein
VAVKRIVLLSPDSELVERTTAEDLSNFVRAIEDVVEEQFADIPRRRGQDLAIECELAPGHEVTFRPAARPGIDREEFQSLSQRLRGLTAPEVSNGPVRFHVLFTIWGGTGEEFG